MSEGDDMTISFAVQLPRPVKHLAEVLSFGRTYGHNWLVVHFGGGYLAGYLRVIEGHPWFRSHDIDRECMRGCHCGISWCGPDCVEYKDVAVGWWFGFNCATGYDYPDENLAKEYGCEVHWKPKKKGQQIRRLDYVEDILIILSQEAYAAIVAEQDAKRRKNG